MARGPFITTEERKKILELVAQGKSYKDVAKEVNRHAQTIGRLVKESKATKQPEQMPGGAA